MRYTEYHDGVAVIKDKALLSKALAKLAKYEDCEDRFKVNQEQAMIAIEKQKPIAPELEGDGYDPTTLELVYDMWVCPTCRKRYEVEYEEYDHCPNCGQAINWDESEEDWR